jgi:hypothetical protein
MRYRGKLLGYVGGPCSPLGSGLERNLPLRQGTKTNIGRFSPDGGGSGEPFPTAIFNSVSGSGSASGSRSEFGPASDFVQGQGAGQAKEMGMVRVTTLSSKTLSINKSFVHK